MHESMRAIPIQTTIMGHQWIVGRSAIYTMCINRNFIFYRGSIIYHWMSGFRINTEKNAAVYIEKLGYPPTPHSIQNKFKYC